MHVARFVIGTAGHVDHGKSALVQALTGTDPDRLAEEKRRGLTIDLGFAWFALPSGREVGIVDVPGHERFIRNMLAGAGAIDVVLFVVAADEGWQPQSQEHLQIVDLLCIRGGVIVVTKCDTVTPEQLAAAVDATRERVRSTVLAGAPIVGVSAKTGHGLDALVAALDDLLGNTPESRDEHRPRMFVDRSFVIDGAGTVVTGTLGGGCLRVDDEVDVVPGGLSARIRSLQTHGTHTATAVPGTRVAANLVGIDHDRIRRGDAIVRAEQWIVTDRFAARLRTTTQDTELPEKGAYELYVGSLETPCRVRAIDDTGLVMVYVDRAVPLRIADRFVIRDAGRRATVAGGVVLDQRPPRIRRGDSEQTHRLVAREGLSGADLAWHIVVEKGIVQRDELNVLASADVDGPAFAIDPAFKADLVARARTVIEAHHRANPLEAGMPRPALRDALGLPQPEFDAVLGTLGLVIEGNVVRSTKHRLALPDADRRRADAGLVRLRAGGTSPPSPREVSMDEPLVRALERAGEVIVLAPGIVFPSDVWADIERRIVEHIAEHGPATASVLRGAIGTSRKYAIPILEKLDATGVTRRVGDLRELAS